MAQLVANNAGLLYSLTKPNRACIFAFLTRGNLLYTHSLHSYKFSYFFFVHIFVWSNHLWSAWGWWTLLLPSTPCPPPFCLTVRLHTNSAQDVSVLGVSKSLWRTHQHLLRPFSWPREHPRTPRWDSNPKSHNEFNPPTSRVTPVIWQHAYCKVSCFHHQRKIPTNKATQFGKQWGCVLFQLRATQFGTHSNKLLQIINLLLLLVFSPWAGLGRDQSSVRRLVWLWYAASWTSS